VLHFVLAAAAGFSCSSSRLPLFFSLPISFFLFFSSEFVTRSARRLFSFPFSTGPRPAGPRGVQGVCVREPGGVRGDGALRHLPGHRRHVMREENGWFCSTVRGYADGFEVHDAGSRGGALALLSYRLGARQPPPPRRHCSRLRCARIRTTNKARLCTL
jgi:hypothetical protein